MAAAVACLRFAVSLVQFVNIEILFL